MTNYTNEKLIEVGRKTIEQRQKYTQRHLVRTKLMITKAIKAGIFVTNDEVDKEITRRSKIK